MSDQLPDAVPQITGFVGALAGGYFLIRAGIAQLRSTRYDAGTMERLEKLEKEVGRLRDEANDTKLKMIEHVRWDYEVVDVAHTAGIELPPPPPLFPPTTAAAT